LLSIKSQIAGYIWSSFRFIIYYITLTYNTLITIKFLGYYKYNEFII